MVNLYADGFIPKTTKVGEFCDIGSKVGEHSKVQTGVSIPPGWELGDYVFYGPGARFANVKLPKLPNKPEILKGKVEDYVTIGMGALIGPGVTLGKGCVVGMGAVVTKDVNPGEIVIGNPAKPMVR